MVPSYTPSPIDCDVDFETGSLAGKTAIVTGGCSGLGEAYVRALSAAKVTVCIADVDAQAGEKLASELPGSKFFSCDVRDWEDQVRLFREAAAFSPSGRIDYVVANAGVADPESVFAYDGDGHEPTKPDSRILDINLNGALYATKLALHYFIKQNGTTQSRRSGTPAWSSSAPAPGSSTSRGARSTPPASGRCAASCTRCGA
ncbi:hypothetical protein LTR53_010079 [Teratosphaeriaceae sp. CCFEE 6253]|nr:hypothetical protein LTR53_010079 [Teratosphaeriaceae sp. CCFEE 6253]